MRQLVFSALLIFAASDAHALATANFTVEGQITGSTCKVGLDTNSTVILPMQKRSALSKAGDTVGKTPFKISVIGCSTNTTIYFESDQTTINAAGRLVNTVVGGAKNVELEILNENGLPLKLSNIRGQQDNSAATIGATPDAATFNYFVQYHAVGAASAGDVKSSLTFLVESF